MFDMDGLPDLLKPCRGGFEVQDRGEESLQFIQVVPHSQQSPLGFAVQMVFSGNLSISVSRPVPKAGGTKLPSGNKSTVDRE